MKRLLIALGMSVSVFLFTQYSSAAAEFPAAFADFEKMTFEQMKALPDAKWPMDKKVDMGHLRGKSETEVVLLRNSIYAQNGFRFSNKALANYFLSRSWYKPNKMDLGFGKLSAAAKANVQTFMKYQAEKFSGRSIATDEANWASQIAYGLFEMGFCTYGVNGDPKAGMVVFDPGGKAQVFHSQASRAAFAPYAYEAYMSSELADMGTSSLLIPAKWSIKINGKKATVTLDFDPSDIAKYTNQEGAPIIGSYTRELLTINMDDKNQDAFVKKKQCLMKKMN